MPDLPDIRIYCRMCNAPIRDIAYLIVPTSSTKLQLSITSISAPVPLHWECIIPWRQQA